MLWRSTQGLQKQYQVKSFQQHDIIRHSALPAFTAGQFHIWDVFQSKAVGNITLTAAYQAAADSKEAAQPAAEAARDEEERAVLCKLTELAQTADAASSATGQTAAAALAVVVCHAACIP